MQSMIVSGKSVGQWVAGRLGTVFGEHDVAIGLAVDGVLVSGVMYENWNRKSIMAHLVTDAPLTRSFLSAVFDYAYRVCAVEKIILPVVVTNTRSVRLVEHMGFTAEATLTDCHPEGDLTLYTLRKSDCRFLRGKYALGQEGTKGTGSP